MIGKQISVDSGFFDKILMADCILADRGWQRRVGVSRCYTEGSTFYKGKKPVFWEGGWHFKAVIKCKNLCRKVYWTSKEISHAAEYCTTHTNRFTWWYHGNCLCHNCAINVCAMCHNDTWIKVLLLDNESFQFFFHIRKYWP